MLFRTPFLAMCLVLSGGAGAAELASFGALAGTAKVFSSPSFDVSLSIGVMGARASETVHATPGDGSGLSPGARISHLKWKTRASAVAGVTLGWEVRAGTRLEAGFSVPVTRDDNHMSNSDWGPAGLTDQSLHPDTRIGPSFNAELRLVQSFYVNAGFSAHALAGLRRTQMSWKAVGGTFKYTEATVEDCASWTSMPVTFNAASDVRNCTGSFDHVPQILYKQYFNVPYLGLRGAYDAGAWNVSADVVGSPFTFSSDRDVHVEDTLFTSRYQRQTMLGSTIRAGYKFMPTATFFIEAEGQWYFHKKGKLSAMDLSTGENTEYGAKTAGVSLTTTRLSAGVRGAF